MFNILIVVIGSIMLINFINSYLDEINFYLGGNLLLELKYLFEYHLEETLGYFVLCLIASICIIVGIYLLRKRIDFYEKGFIYKGNRYSYNQILSIEHRRVRGTAGVFYELFMLKYNRNYMNS